MRQVQEKVKHLSIIYLGAFVVSAFLVLKWGLIPNSDGESYITAWQAFSHGRLDQLRTPVYPLFLHVIQSIFGPKAFLTAAILVQHLLFLISVYFFYSLTKSLFGSSTAFWVTLFYAVFPSISSWNNLIMTESLAISGSVFLLWTIHRLRRRPSFLYGILLTVIVIFLLFLRPAFIYLLPVLGVFSVLLFWKNEIFPAILILSGSIISCLLMLAYMAEYKKEYGIFAVSDVSIINQYYIARNSDIIDPSLTKNTDLQHAIEEFLINNGEDAYVHIAFFEALDLCEQFSLPDIQSLLKESPKANPQITLSSLLSRALLSGKENFFNSRVIPIDRLTMAVGLNMNTLYLFLIIFVFILCRWIFYQKNIPPFSSLLLMLGISNIIVAVVGAQNDWGRLIQPSMPIWLLLFAQFCACFKTNDSTVIQ